MPEIPPLFKKAKNLLLLAFCSFTFGDSWKGTSSCIQYLHLKLIINKTQIINEAKRNTKF